MVPKCERSSFCVVGKNPIEIGSVLRSNVQWKAILCRYEADFKCRLTVNKKRITVEMSKQTFSVETIEVKKRSNRENNDKVQRLTNNLKASAKG